MSRTCLLDLSVGLVENLQRRGVPRALIPESFSADYQICFPYLGLFVWEVAGEEVVADPNQVVFVRGGEAFRVHGPLPQGYAELIITPDLEILSELAHQVGRWRLADHPLFAHRTCRARPQLQCARARFQHRATAGEYIDALEADEEVVALMQCALNQSGMDGEVVSARSARLVRAAKEFLEAHIACRILLTDIARAVGASPAYLTNLFKRTEGVSLHQYLTRLRLARSLIELPHADDLTSLALDLGFSSHSHFTYAFRRTYECTPSEFRATTGAY